MVEAVKWVDVVLKGVPYDVNESFMQELFEARALAHFSLALFSSVSPPLPRRPRALSRARA
jgi:hypothetical protein